jgi:general secretion pathway protein L
LSIFLAPGGAGVEGWIRTGPKGALARGDGLQGLEIEVGPQPPVIAAIAPAEEVAIHWLDLPGNLAPAQAVAAARLMLADACAEPIGAMHVAVGGDSAGGRRCVAVAPLRLMEQWLAGLAEAGIDPDHVIPEPMLMAPPRDGARRVERDGISLCRAQDAAFGAEPGLADLLIGERPVEPLDESAFEAGLPYALAAPELDLRQGAFARRRRWRVRWPTVRRLAFQAVGLLAATLALQVAAVLRYTLAADRTQAEAREIAAAALPGAPPGNVVRQLDTRIAELKGPGAGFDSTAGALFAAVQATPGVELSAMSFGGDGLMRARVQAQGAAPLAALAGRLRQSGFSAEQRAPASGGGRTVVEIVMRPAR